MIKDFNIGFIGAGNMGEAIINGILQSGVSRPKNIYACDYVKERETYIQEKYKINIAQSNINLFDTCDLIILAIKPQQMPDVLGQIADQPSYRISRRKIVVSIAAGIPIELMERHLYVPLDESARKNLPIIRVMPNTPALVLSGMSGMCPNRFANEDDLQITKKILHSIGKVLEFKEEDLDAVTAVSGSGPAYVFYLVEAMVDAGIALGLDPCQAMTLSITTLSGAAKLLTQMNESPESLRKKVTSKGGTTEAAINHMENNSVKANIIEALKKAALRSKELSQVLGQNP